MSNCMCKYMYIEVYIRTDVRMTVSMRVRIHMMVVIRIITHMTTPRLTTLNYKRACIRLSDVQ